MDNRQKESNFISAVVYINDNSSDIEVFLKTLYETLHANFKNAEIICVDDATQNGTNEKIKKISESFKETELTVLHMGHYQGMEAAMRAGIDMCIGDFVFEFDSTILDYGPQNIMETYLHALKGYDVVNMAPSIIKSKSSKLFYKVFNKYSDLPYKISTNRFRVISRRAINRVHDVNAVIPYRKVAYASSGLKVATLNYQQIALVTPNVNVKSNASSELAINSLLMFTNIGYRFSLVMSIIFMLLTLLMGLYAAIIFLTGRAVEGWTTTMLFMSVSFLGVFIVQTVMVKYMSIVMKLLVNKKEYKVEGIEKVTR